MSAETHLTPERLAQLRSEDRLPSPRGTALAVVRMSQKDDTSLNDLAGVVATDPALTGRLIKAANGLLPYGQRPVAAIRDALRLLGLSAVRGLALGFCLLGDYRQGKCAAFPYDKYWTRSLLRAIALQEVSRRIRVLQVEEAFSIGLLARIGELALATAFPAVYGEMLASCTAPDDRRRKEIERFGIDAAKLSAVLLLDWRFPAALADPVGWQGDGAAAPFREGSRQRTILDGLDFADSAADVCLAEPSARGGLLGEMTGRGARLGLDADAVHALGDAVVADWQAWSSVLGLSSGQLPAFADLSSPSEPEGELDVELVEPEDNRLRVLVVDDQQPMRKMVRALLERLGYEVEEAGDGVEGLARARELKPDLMVLDWMMPGMDGLAVTRALRDDASGRSIFILLLTGHSDDEQLVEAFSAGVDDFIAKPLKARVFAARLRAARRIITLRREIIQDRKRFQNWAKDFATTQRRLQELARSDALTGLPHRQQGVDALHQLIMDSRRQEQPLGAVLLRIDDLAGLNRRHGRQAVDRLLQAITDLLRRGLRPGDQACRYSASSWLLSFPNASPDQATAAGRRLMAALSGVVAGGVPAGLGWRTASLNGGMCNEDDFLNALEAAPVQR